MEKLIAFYINNLAIHLEQLTISIIFFIFLASPLHAWQSNNVKKANDFISAGMTSEAIYTLEAGIKEEPKEHEAHWMLGKLYLERGSYSSAEERFNSAVLLKSSYKLELGSVYKAAADTSLAKNKPRQAVELFDMAMRYGSYDRQFYLTAGDRLSGNQAVDCYQRAALDNNLKDKAGKKILIMAVKDEYNREKFKKIGTDYLGQEFVEQVFPEPYMKEYKIREKPFTIDDAFQHSQIAVIDTEQFPLKEGDLIEIQAISKRMNGFEGKEIYIWKGKNFNPKWESTKNGYYKEKVQVEGKKGKYIISLDGRKDVEVTVKVSRKIYPEPNITLLDNM